MKFFTASIPARILASFSSFDNSKLQSEQEKIYNRIIQNNYNSDKINSCQVKNYKNETKFLKEMHADLL